ncbi:hypothetical protein EAE96_001539 [Botrytis aclada]|nr:hypothetical protein EAE96_001539 [Botrytis aclada]
MSKVNPRIIFKDDDGIRKIERGKNACKIFKSGEVLSDEQKERKRFLEDKFNTRQRKRRKPRGKVPQDPNYGHGNDSEDDGHNFQPPDDDADDERAIYDAVVEELANIGLHDTSRRKPNNAYSNLKKEENWKKIHRAAAETLVDEKQCGCRYERSCTGKMTKFNVICISLLNVAKFDSEFCQCVGSKVSRLISWRLFPGSSVNPRIAFDLDTLEFFHNISMGGRLAKKNFATGLQNTLQSKFKIRIMNLERTFTTAYHNWLEVRRISQEIVIEKAKLASVELPTRKVLSEMCPCCFFREGDDWGPSKPWRAGTDGNFQFRRLPHAGETKKTLRQQPVSDIFVKDLPDNDPSPSDLTVKRDDGCPHHFTAAKSMTHSLGKYKGQDQTGLMNFVCEHEICLRLKNLYRGEQFNVTYDLLASIIDELPDNAHGLLHYDIGCKLGPWLQRTHPNTAERVRVAMNAFHAYAHTITCQMEYGPFRTELVALSCGEYTVRDWSRKSSIVICCRCSTAKHRESLVTEHSFWHNRIQRSKLGFTLERKYKKAMEDQIYYKIEM